MKKKRQSTVVFLEGTQLPERAAVEAALADLEGALTWRDEHETKHSLAASLALGEAEVALSIIGGPLERDLYEEPLAISGLDEADRARIEGHGIHSRVVFMDQENPVEPVDRMTLVYRVAARLCRLGGIAVLAPASGVFVIGLEPQHVDKALEEEVPPLDMWIAVEKTGDDRVRTVGASYIGLPEVELEGIGILDPESTFSTVMDVLLYLRRIRRELIPGEALHVGDQPWRWMTMRGEDNQVSLKRVAVSETTEG